MINRIIHANIHITWHISPWGPYQSPGWYGATRADMQSDMDFTMYYSLYINIFIQCKEKSRKLVLAHLIKRHNSVNSRSSITKLNLICILVKVIKFIWIPSPIVEKREKLIMNILSIIKVELFLKNWFQFWTGSVNCSFVSKTFKLV
jgi:hypothetical protein